MTVLNIYSLDDTELQNVIACLPEGRHVIGRGDLLKVSDKRVSRKHAVIEVLNDKATLTSVHINPCFFKAVDGRTLTILKQNEQNELHDGDEFALLPEDLWFRVKLKKEPRETEQIHFTKRPLTEEPDNMESTKRVCLSHNTSNNEANQAEIAENDNNINHSKEEDDNADNLEQLHQSNIDNENQPVIVEYNNINQPFSPDINLSIHFEETTPLEDEIKIELVDDVSDHGATVEVKEEPQDGEQPSTAGNTLQDAVNGDNAQVELKTENNAEESGVAGASGTNTNRNVRRERCWYGNTCFRKNPNHRATFSHPGDPDYESDPDDDRPHCPYGTACYRKNIDHRRDYRHTNAPAAAPIAPQVALPKKPKRAKKANAPKTNDSQNDEEDDYDYSDPFLNDASSDDYQPSDCGIDSSSDDDDQDAQEAESEDRRRMLKEAKKFTKAKKN